MLTRKPTSRTHCTQKERRAGDRGGKEGRRERK
jgi:hypothetical protein